jgi:alpha/beta superfamily hydrolase
MGMLLADGPEWMEGRTGDVVPEWRWLSAFGWVINVGSVLAACAQVAVFVLLARQRRTAKVRARSPPATSSARPSRCRPSQPAPSCGESAEHIMCLPRVMTLCLAAQYASSIAHLWCCPARPNPDQIDHLVAGVRGVAAAARSRWPVSVVVAMYALFLLSCIGGFFAGLVAPEGEPYEDIRVSSCSGCYCRPHLNASSIAVLRNVLYSEETWVGKDGKVNALDLDVYRSTASVRQKRHLISMASAGQGAAAGRSPAVIIIHGGGFEGGRKEDGTIEREARYLAQHGFLTFAVNYRTTAKRGLPDVGSIRDAIRDIQVALTWVAARGDVDASRIAMFGTSAGAIAAASIDLVSPNNQTTLTNISAAVGISGCVWPFLLPTRFQEKAPLPAPWMDVHGDQDDRVFMFLAEYSARFLRHMGLAPDNNILAVVDGGGHVDVNAGVKGSIETWGQMVRDSMRPKYTAFLVRTMKLEGHDQC